MNDIVYYFQGEDSEELKYSIRSVEENLSFNRIFLIGDKPKWFKETKRSIYIESKNLNLQAYGLGSVPILHLRKLLKSGKMPEKFLLFNDDFFIMKNVENWKDYYRDEKDYEQKALHNHVYHKKTVRSWIYTEERKAYNLHIPIEIEKEDFEKCLEFWNKLKIKDIDFRTLYGNMFIKTNNSLKDCKISLMNTEMNLDNFVFISTSDESFRNGNVGKYIKEKFARPSFLEML